MLHDGSVTWRIPGESQIARLHLQRDLVAGTFRFVYVPLPLPSIAQSILINRGCPPNTHIAPLGLLGSPLRGRSRFSRPFWRSRRGAHSPCSGAPDPLRRPGPTSGCGSHRTVKGPQLPQERCRPERPGKGHQRRGRPSQDRSCSVHTRPYGSRCTRCPYAVPTLRRSHAVCHVRGRRVHGAVVPASWALVSLAGRRGLSGRGTALCRESVHAPRAGRRSQGIVAANAAMTGPRSAHGNLPRGVNGLPVRAAVTSWSWCSTCRGNRFCRVRSSRAGQVGGACWAAEGHSGADAWRRSCGRCRNHV